MSEKRVKISFPPPSGPLVDASEVPVTESTERWTDVTLEDGTKLRLKPTVLSVTRLDGQYDPDGNPMYLLKSSQVMVADAPPHLRKGAAAKGVH